MSVVAGGGVSSGTETSGATGAEGGVMGVSGVAGGATGFGWEALTGVARGVLVGEVVLLVGDVFGRKTMIA